MLETVEATRMVMVAIPAPRMPCTESAVLSQEPNAKDRDDDGSQREPAKSQVLGGLQRRFTLARARESSGGLTDDLGRRRRMRCDGGD